MFKKFIIVQTVFIVIIGVMLIVYLKTSSTSEVLEKIQTYIASTTPTKVEIKQDNEQSKSFISPDTLADANKHFIINFKPLREKLAVIQGKYLRNSYIYFLYFNNTSWIGFNEKELFTAASTIKVPLAMAIYKMEKEGKLKAQDVYTLDALDLDQRFGDLYKIGPDNSLTIEQLVNIMLVYSDNTAMQALFHVMSLLGIHDPLADVYDSMGWEYDNFGQNPTYIKINLKTLSNMFVSLYNSTYLDVNNSMNILSALSESVFHDQLVAGVPQNTVVAHKVGINISDNTYSDCGIVYAPNRPYILCVGISGVEQKKANTFISDISRTVYQFVINN